jgi:hypothetical protein
MTADCGLKWRFLFNPHPQSKALLLIRLTINGNIQLHLLETVVDFSSPCWAE